MNPVKELVSALMDGELPEDECREVLDALKADSASREVWHEYHRIGDLLRGIHYLSDGS